MTSCPFFSKWRPATILDLVWVISDNPRCVIVGLSLVLKFGLDPMYSFGDMAISTFRRFGFPIDFCIGQFTGLQPCSATALRMILQCLVKNE